MKRIDYQKSRILARAVQLDNGADILEKRAEALLERAKAMRQMPIAVGQKLLDTMRAESAASIAKLGLPPDCVMTARAHPLIGRGSKL